MLFISDKLFLRSG